MARFLAAVALSLVSASTLAGPVTFVDTSGNRVVSGKGSFPRWQALLLATETPLRWLVALAPRRLAAVDRDGTLWVFEVGAGGLRVAARYGEVASADSPPTVAGLDGDRSAIALVASDGRLALWSDGTLRSYDVGAPLSRLTVPTPVRLADRTWDDLLAVAADGAVVLIAGLPSVPRVIARVEVRALPDARITLTDLDGDGVPEAVVLTNGTDRSQHGPLSDRLEAGSVTVIGLVPNGLAVRTRYTLASQAVFEDLVPVLAPIDGGGQPAVLLTRSMPEQGVAAVALGLREGGLVPLAEGPPSGQTGRWSHVVGATDLSGDGIPEILAVRTPPSGGVLAAYRRRGSALVPVAQAGGYFPRASGSGSQDQVVVADLDGDGRPDLVVPRQSRDTVAGLQLEGARFAERWTLPLKSTVESNLVVADLDGDGLLDLAVADRRSLHVFLSVK